MGLDMYASAAPLNERVKDEVQVDFTEDELGLELSGTKQLWYWRKHHDLHGWMHRLYTEKGGVDPDFNMNTVRLMHKDLDRLQEDVELNKLPKTTGFFFGNYPPDDESKAEDLKFIEEARRCLDKGMIVWYHSWW